eukprot:scaffold31709_cov41-Cyclotella_meneghiniana.AAC.20
MSVGQTVCSAARNPPIYSSSCLELASLLLGCSVVYYKAHSALGEFEEFWRLNAYTSPMTRKKHPGLVEGEDDEPRYHIMVMKRPGGGLKSREETEC